MIGKDWFIASVTFERRDLSPVEGLPDHAQGAVGWMACQPADGEIVRDLIEAALKAVNLRLVGIERQAAVHSLAEIALVDEHLATNVRSMEPGKTVVWGTCHAYVADGEG